MRWGHIMLLLLLLSRFSRVRLCDPIDGSPPGFPSLGFSRQEHWSGLPFPFPRHESEKWKLNRSFVSDSSRSQVAACNYNDFFHKKQELSRKSFEKVPWARVWNRGSDDACLMANYFLLLCDHSSNCWLKSCATCSFGSAHPGHISF